MRYQLILFIISLWTLLATCEKSKYSNYQDQEIIKIVNSDKVIIKRCFVTSLPKDFHKSRTEDNITSYRLLYTVNFDFCNITNLILTGYDAVVVTPSNRCGLIQQKTNARAFNIKILLYVVNQQVALPNVPSELNNAPAVVLMPIALFDSGIQFWNNSNIGIYGSANNETVSRVSEVVIFSLVTITIVMLMAVTVGCTYEILESEEPVDNANNDQSNSPGHTTGDSDKSGQFKYIAIIIPVFMIGMLLLMYFFFFVMVWVIIVAFYLISAYCFSMILMLFVKKYNFGPTLRKPFNRWGFRSIDYRYISLFIFGLVISTVWIVFRKTDLGLAFNNIIGVYICISVSISIGAMFVINRNFKMLLALLAIVLVIDAVMVYVPIGNSKPDVSQQISLYSPNNEVVRVKRSNGNSIMESVATAMSGSSSEEIPIRFKIPKIPYIGQTASNDSCYIYHKQFSLIGFGDLILPCAFIVYMLFYAIIGKSNVILYFVLTFFGYEIGLVLTYVAVVLSGKGQPALVFLLPCTVLPTLLVTVIRKEFVTLWYGNWMPQRLDPISTELVQSSGDNI